MASATSRDDTQVRRWVEYLQSKDPGERAQARHRRVLQRQHLQPLQPGQSVEVVDPRAFEREELQTGQPGELAQSA